MKASNVKDMRETLETVHRIAYTAKNDFDVFAGIERIRRISEAALAKPPRNCDVGTPEEQWRRFKKHCEENLQADDPDYCSSICDVNGGCVSECALKWAQMPYEEGGAK